MPTHTVPTLFLNIMLLLLLYIIILSSIARVGSCYIYDTYLVRRPVVLYTSDSNLEKVCMCRRYIYNILYIVRASPGLYLSAYIRIIIILYIIYTYMYIILYPLKNTGAYCLPVNNGRATLEIH